MRCPRLCTAGTLEIYELTFENNNQSGFHTHPGPAYVVVTKGTLLEDKGCGVTVEHPAGSAFQEEPGEVHNVTNGGHEAVRLYVMQLVPLDTPDCTEVDPPACK